MKYNIAGSEITKEKNLWQVALLARKITMSKLHIVIIISTAMLLIINSFLLAKKTDQLLLDIRGWSNFGFNFTITTLGFLIAGFTIFATLSKPDMMIAMMLHENKEAKIPTLKYNFMAFMKVFISFIACTLIYLFIILLGQTNGFLANIIRAMPYSEIIKPYGIKTSYVVIGTSLVYLVLAIKTFIYNVYAIVMTSVRWEYEKNQKEERERQSNNS
ncbi:conserved hypothetical protein [Dickeya parazeae Ech586]|uniref:Uncharacterized protein n=1 Tax=Dickeya zeae (strain Ech586) TaxID=590409 RepID=D2BSJ9_DICZ5|nr:hypothetical protein [Dickeya parazeae]ACZ75618.1 conserved hypothetical protein [Dickeya parazeae Ech586]